MTLDTNWSGSLLLIFIPKHPGQYPLKEFFLAPPGAQWVTVLFVVVCASVNSQHKLFQALKLYLSEWPMSFAFMFIVHTQYKRMLNVCYPS